MLVLTSEITIGQFKFSGVHEVTISRTMHAITDKAVIKIPSLTRLSGSHDLQPTGKHFSDGDPVTIMLGYNGDLATEFKGFVTNRSLGMLLEVTCEGYGALLKKVKVNISERDVTVASLLETAIKGTDAPITLQCEADVVLQNVQIQGNGLDVIQAIARFSDGCITCFFVEPNVLWCGYLYTAWAKGVDTFRQGKVAYKLGYNVLPLTQLQPRLPAATAPAVQYSKHLRGGGYISGLSNVFKNGTIVRQRTLNQVQATSALRQMANEKALKMNYQGYNGTLNTILQPAAQPGMTAFIADPNYPSHDGNYLVESVATTFGILGARRKVELGPAFGFQK